MTNDSPEKLSPEDRHLAEETARLPRSLSPDRDLWPGIEARIRPGWRANVVRGRFDGWGRGLLALAAVLLLFVAIQEVRTVRDADPDVARSVPEPTDLDHLDHLDAEYAAAAAELLGMLGESESLDPETVELIRRNLEIIDGAVREIRDALGDDPDNPRLNRMLNAEYRHRRTVLREAAELTESI